MNNKRKKESFLALVVVLHNRIAENARSVIKLFSLLLAIIERERERWGSSRWGEKWINYFKILFSYLIFFLNFVLNFYFYFSKLLSSLLCVQKCQQKALALKSQSYDAGCEINTHKSHNMQKWRNRFSFVKLNPLSPLFKLMDAV